MSYCLYTASNPRLRFTIMLFKQNPSATELELLIQENSKLQDLILFTEGLVTKRQSGWGFTVKQCVTTINKDSVTYKQPNIQLDERSGSSHISYLTSFYLTYSLLAFHKIIHLVVCTY